MGLAGAPKPGRYFGYVHAYSVFKDLGSRSGRSGTGVT